MPKSRGYRDLIIYQKAFAVAMEVFALIKKFPREERYALTDQIRRSSRSVCSCTAEAYRKRMYEKVFVNKISDADTENSETVVWLEFAHACHYITLQEMLILEQKCEEVGRMLNSMLNSPEKFLPLGKKSKPS
jgi:four helix bundle protein